MLSKSCVSLKKNDHVRVTSVKYLLCVDLFTTFNLGSCSCQSDK